MKAPPIPRDLLEYLRGVFPDKLPETPSGAPETLAALVGQQQVIRHLDAQFKLQSRTVIPAT